MQIFAAVLLLSLAVASTALQHVFKENARSLHNLRDDFVRKAEVDPSTYHQVVFAVKQQNLDKLEQILNEVSTPGNPKYGKYLSRGEVAALTANTEATAKIQKFLSENGATVTKTTPYGEYITALAPVSVWQNLLATTFYEFEHVEKKTIVRRAQEYSVPADISEEVDAIFQTVQLPAAQGIQVWTSPSLNATAGSTIVPSKLNSYYHITSNNGNGLGSQCLYESLGQYYSPADLTAFQKKYNLPFDSVDQVIGGHEDDQQCVKDGNNCAEANLDVQYLMAVAQTVPTTYWYDDTNDAFVHWIQSVSANAKPPLVHSISYGAIESYLSKSETSSFNTEAQKLGVQGVTILASSGDDGVANFQARGKSRKCGYNPSFPASSPYVTAVGGTQGPESGAAEIACTSDKGGIITTGGGFSTLFSAPDFQTATIKSYFAGLSSSQKPASGYSTTGRGYPDISIAAYNYEVMIGGKVSAVSGTSASSPVVAGFVSLVNAARIKAGKAPLGWINPAIYKAGTSIVTNDITSGFNNCAAANSNPTCCTQGFYATKGWDPVTGFGSVDYQKFYNYFFNL